MGPKVSSCNCGRGKIVGVGGAQSRAWRRSFQWHQGASEKPSGTWDGGSGKPSKQHTAEIGIWPRLKLSSSAGRRILFWRTPWVDWSIILCSKGGSLHWCWFPWVRSPRWITRPRWQSPHKTCMEMVKALNVEGLSWLTRLFNIA